MDVSSLQQKKSQNSKNKTNNNIIDYISLVKLLACFSVVILHSNSAFWTFKYYKYKSYWISANLIESIFYFAVPFFVLSIGATLLDFNEKYSLKKYWIRRFKKVVIPLVSWTIILYFYKVYIIKINKKEKINFVYIWNVYYGHKIYAILGSFHIFLLTYMIIPLLAYVEKPKKINIFSYCFITLLITQSIIPYLVKLLEPRLILVYQLNVGYIVYIFAGYIVQNYRFKIISKLIIYFLGIFGFLIHTIGTKILTLRYKKVIRLHKGYLNLPCILYSCSLFLFIKDNSYLLFKIINKNIINKIATLTIGPFFIHLPIIDLSKIYLKIDIFSLGYRLYGGIIICLVCLIITFILKKIPIIKYLVP